MFWERTRGDGAGNCGDGAHNWDDGADTGRVQAEFLAILRRTREIVR
jgi:hypothetical protein